MFRDNCAIFRDNKLPVSKIQLLLEGGFQWKLGFKFDNLCSLKMAQLYRNMVERLL
jgi:hypothetical protein